MVAIVDDKVRESTGSIVTVPFTVVSSQLIGPVLLFVVVIVKL